MTLVQESAVLIQLMLKNALPNKVIDAAVEDFHYIQFHHQGVAPLSESDYNTRSKRLKETISRITQTDPAKEVLSKYQLQ